MPTIELKETTGCTKKFQVEIEQDRVDEQIKKTVKTLKKDIQVPGFRKGKAPEAMLLKRFGASIRQEAIRDLIPGLLDELFAKEGVKPVSEPDIEDFEMEDSGPVSFNVSIEELPEVDISGFDGVVITKENRKITDEIVDNEIERIRQMYARQEDVERPVEKNDIVVVNLQKLDESGVPIVGEKMENHAVVLDGKSTPSPDFDEQLVGMKVGDEKRVTYTFDKSIDNPDLVGTSESYDVSLQRVLINIVPDLDDEFVKQFGEFENFAAFRDVNEKRLQAQFDSMTERKLRSDLMEAFVSQSPFEVPGSMIERVILSEMDRARKTNPNAPVDENDYRTRMRPDAVRAVQSFIIVDAIKKQKEIEVSKEELDKRLESAAAANSMETKEFRRRMIKEGGFDDFKSNIAEDLAYDWMLETSTVEEKTIVGFEDQVDSDIVVPD